MANNVNFYESLPEANMRLRNTIVLYDGEPYWVAAITNHKNDGIFRVYMEALQDGCDMAVTNPGRPPYDEFDVLDPALGHEMDRWMDDNSGKMLRKHINSPKFKKFRPFPLGMMFQGDYVYYIERQPTRNMEQGLTRRMLVAYKLSLDSVPDNRANSENVQWFSNSFRDTILGNYPSPGECLKEMQDPWTSNTAAAFHRHFALVRGPCHTLFLAHNDNIIGSLPYGDFTTVRVDGSFGHLKETIEDLTLFENIIITEVS